MGEAAPYLMRSVSQPHFASCEYKEGDLQRALTTSISFGRFMTEPLDWERWSSFSHNRTLEDVQKHSRPGAVAEKKAFFEAHYKKIASKKATKSPLKENNSPNSSPQTNIITNISPPKENKPPNFSSQTNIITNISPPKENKPPNFSPQTNIITNISPPKENKPPNSSPQTNITTNISPPRSDTNSAINETQENESSKPVTTNQAFSHINEQEVPSCKDVCSPSTNLVATQFENFEDDVAVEQGKVSTKNVSVEKHRVDKSKRNKGPEVSLSKKEGSRRMATLPIYPKKGTARDVTEKKRTALQSLHMSMNFLPFGNKNGTSKTITKPKDTLIQQPLNLLKVSVNGLKKNSQVLPTPDKDNRSHLNASSVCTKKPRSSSTVISSFSFRSEERAAKRKEFFQKLEEKGNTKEKEKIHLQPKSKAINDIKKLRSTTTLEAKPCTSETKLGRKSIPKLLHESKNFIEINKKKLTTSTASLPIKKMPKK